MAIVINPGGGSGGSGGVPKEGASVILTSKKEVPNSTSFLIPWDEAASEAKLGFNTGVWSAVNKERFTATATGGWALLTTIWYDAESSTGERALHCVLEGNSKKKLGGMNHALNSTNGRVIQCFASMFLTSGQWVANECFQDSTAVRKLEKDGWETEFPMARATFWRFQ